MKAKSERQYSLMIVSASEQFNTLVKRSIPNGSFDVIEIRKSISLAQRELLSRRYDVVVINSPLPDDLGVNFALDIASRYTSGVLLVAPGEICDDVAEHVIDQGIIPAPKPINKNTIEHSIRHLCADQDKIKSLEKKLSTADDKLEEMRIVNKAKWLLIANEGMTEADAHRYIGKKAMDNCVSKRIIAEEIIDKWED
ncbi:MAG: ANTAR domain-containing protein [Lachnospiraceae bacterium]|nr:ANTAR domain-containing protein [Lachnospiraceae bacterium]